MRTGLVIFCITGHDSHCRLSDITPTPLRPTIEYIQERFDRYNSLMFGGRLPRIPVKISDAKSYLGQCVSRVATLPDGRKEHSGFELRISTRLDLPAETVDDTIIHEMIHYFIHYNGLPDTSAHGPIFRSIMHGINARYGRHISVSHHSTPEQRAESDSRPALHVIAVMTIKGLPAGHVGIKILPRTAARVIEFHRRISSSPDVVNVSLYLHDDPFFNRYPVSVALRYHPVSHSELSPHLDTARRIEISGNTLKYAK
ncbi:MAG: SprT-like domain-containing protein [Paenibacillus sp.]|nr:SprT-like domain-containing protein [Paenibacillus sp.]